jgi:hypothetical protein
MSLMLRSVRASMVLVVLAGVIAVSSAAQAARVVNVSTSSALQNAVRNALTDDEIVVAPGTYYPTLFLTIPASANNVTVRGATGNRDDVIIRGAGMNVDTSNREGFAIYGDNATIKDLTVAEFFFHAIHFQPGADNITLSNIVTRNNGQQHIKGAKYNIGGLIENSLCEQTYVRTNMASDPRGVDYVGGIDLHGGVNWIIRDTTVRNIMGAGGDADGSIFAWNQCSNITVERCVVTGGNRAICFGNNSGGSLGYDVDGGIIRNCFVYARTGTPSNPAEPWTGNADIGIDLAHVRNVNVYNNTVWTNSGSYSRSIQIYDKSARRNVNLNLAYNIVRGNINNLSGSPYTLTGNILGNVPQANWFLDAANANYHLTKLATPAIGQAAALAEVPTDFDGQARPLGGAVDVGADEFVAADTNGDGLCDVVDLLTLVGTFGLYSGDPGYDASADFNGDNTVDVVDLLTLVDYFGL